MKCAGAISGRYLSNQLSSSCLKCHTSLQRNNSCNKPKYIVMVQTRISYTTTTEVFHGRFFNFLCSPEIFVTMSFIGYMSDNFFIFSYFMSSNINYNVHSLLDILTTLCTTK